MSNENMSYIWLWTS